MGGMGNWEIELEMEKINEMFWFHKKKCNHLLQAESSILINFLPKCCLKVTYKIIGNQIKGPTNYNWDGDF
jgi:hypothetical protein